MGASLPSYAPAYTTIQRQTAFVTRTQDVNLASVSL